ncbi:MAG: LysM peptidoglycan-binding domain-containing protein [Chloroflexi bacterium]|nr:LysM peptidoglycan-binding domain-containing protein [Chloroflexota bacterium]
MQWKRLAYYLLINVIVSVCTTLLVLSIWDRTHSSETESLDPVSVLPSEATSTPIPVEAVPTPTISLQPYQVSPGETLGEIALMFDISVDELLEINGFTDPNSIGTGEIIFVPAPEDTTTAEPPAAVTGEELPPEATSSPVDDGQIEIVAVFGVGDLASERVQLLGVGDGSLSLAGWLLKDEDGHIYTFPHITLFSDGAVNLYTKVGVDTVMHLFWSEPEAVWEAGEVVTLLDVDGNERATYRVP